MEKWNDQARFMDLYNGWCYDGSGSSNTFRGTSSGDEIMFKTILVGAALFAAPAMAQATVEEQTIDALINMVAAEVACGIKVPPAAVNDVLSPISHLIPVGRAGELGKAIRKAGEARGYEALRSPQREEFCIRIARTYGRFGY